MGSEANNNGGGGGGGGSSGSVEVLSWLKGLAVAPEYHPTLDEFQDPIAYIFKIEKEASRYGICKIVPPVSPAPKKSVLMNLNRSLSARSGGGPTFTTRQQQIGFCPRKHHRPVQKPVWQSGECYTVQEFEAKAKLFERAYLRKFGKKPLNALEIETLFWKATLDKPFSVEYANDMPGSAFSVKKDRGSGGGEGKNNTAGNNCNVVVGETEWNMRGVSRAKGSLLRFMKEEIPGVTSPMVYIAMMFSWFAWHVEDHDLHSLNYLHMGAGKTWYGVPRDAAVAFEDVIRVHGYGGEINPLVTFATLGEKTTVMSPEVLISAGVPCCRLVQNPGEFVVTFPRAYHSGFSHGFNCGEAANIATPEWLSVAEDAAIRRASINCPPMVSHFQLLYDLALSLCSRVPKRISMEPRSSRLKDKKKDEGQILVKDLFVQDVLQNNILLHILGKGSSVVILPRISLSKSICSNLQGGFQSKMKARLFTSLCSPDLEVKTRKSLVSEDVMLDSNQGSKQVTGAHVDTRNDGDQCDRVTSQGLFSCITCGILCFASVAIVQPSKTAAQYLMSGDCRIFNNWEGQADCLSSLSEDAAAPGSNSSKGLLLKRTRDSLFDVPIESAGRVQPLGDDNAVVILNTEAHNGTSSLGLLALNYGNCSDSEDDISEAGIPVEACETKSRSCSLESGYDCDNIGSAYHGASNCHDPPCPLDNCADETHLNIDDSDADHGLSKAEFKGKSEGSFDYSRPKSGLKNMASSCRLGVHKDTTRISAALGVSESIKNLFAPRSDEDSSRMHIFCLQHAVQVEKQLRSIGGAHVVLLCHPDYPDIEAQAKKVAEELGNVHLWSDIPFREASKEDEERIQLVLDSEEAIHGNGDWAVKLGINLYYSANLSRSPLYSKQMPYNHIIYNAFGCSSTANNVEDKANGKGSGRHKKIVVAGKWCGKVWMSNQVHPLLAEKESEEHEQERNMPCPVEADVKLQRPSETTKTAETASKTCKVGSKRKTSAESRSVIKAESLESEDPDKDFEVRSVSGRQHKRNPRNKRMKKDTPEAQMKRVRHGKQLEAEDSEEDFDVPLISSKQHKNNLRNKRMKKETPEPQMKCVRHGKRLEAEDPEDDLQNLLISGKQHKNNLRNKRMKKETPEPQMKNEGKGKQLDTHDKDEMEGGPSTRLRKRTAKPSKELVKKVEVKPDPKKQNKSSKAKKGPDIKVPNRFNNSKMKEGAEYQCDMEGCSMSFGLKQELILHKKNICPVKGCGKKFFSHKYLVQHRRVHLDDRPLKCPWKGCKMTFKWAWARTEHIRVHTGDRPYVCAEPGCGQTFRFVSDFSRHKRKTGHISKKVKR